MSKEKDAFSNHEQSFDQEGLREIASERYKELANEREKTIEKKESNIKKREEVMPGVEEMTEEEYRAMKWKYNIESGLSNLMKSILEAANVSKEEVEEFKNNTCLDLSG